MHENHPIVLIFFVGLLSISEIAFVPAAWPELSLFHRFTTLTLISLPYYCLYKCVTVTSPITPRNLSHELSLFPYDRIIFHPGYICTTCDLPKPPRSKHCSICKTCVSKQDHHCIWLQNCVGRNNYRYFLSLLASLTVMMSYGVYLGYSLLDNYIQSQLVRANPHVPNPLSTHWSKDETWSLYFNIWAMAITENVRIGAVALLSFFTTPLTVGFLAYHTYLVWAGMTTNESSKWADWRDDIFDGLVYVGSKKEIYGEETAEEKVRWPIQADQTLIFVPDGRQPRYRLQKQSGSGAGAGANEVVDDTREEAWGSDDLRWKRVAHISEVSNIYDLGFVENLERIFRRDE